MMRVAAFAGPSLTAEDRAAHPGIAWHPPAEAGDMLRLDVAPGDTVCLIDGAFDRRPAVRHKELLLLLSRGVRVVGASSIGALRAAEMASFGMTGVGAIFRAFASGRLQADDEVALVHGPERWGWRALSLPLVDCRAALHAGVRRNWLHPKEARAVLAAAKAIHYADRDWPGVLRLSGIASSRRQAVAPRLQSAPSRKRLDALACLDAAASAAAPLPRPAMVRTTLFDALARDCGITR